MHYIGIQQQDHLICEVTVHGTTVRVLDKSFIKLPPPPGGLIYFKHIWGEGGLIEREGLFEMGSFI